MNHQDRKRSLRGAVEETQDYVYVDYLNESADSGPDDNCGESFDDDPKAEGVLDDYYSRKYKNEDEDWVPVPTEEETTISNVGIHCGPFRKKSEKPGIWNKLRFYF